LPFDYDKDLYQTYRQARALLPETEKTWVEALKPFLVPDPAQTFLDLGSGTGRFSIVLAEAVHAFVIGIEPSRKMRGIAEKESSHPHVRYAGGSGERIPLARQTCDSVWLSMVVHHLADREAAIHEIYRVLKPGGSVFIRNAFGDRLEGIPCYRFFPAACAIDTARLPGIDTVRREMEAGGFVFIALDPVRQVIDRSLSDHLSRMRKKGLSTFHLISDDEFESGLASMAEAAARESRPAPVMESIDLLVFQKPA
jgi:SAM-dependent methyltransferase